MNKRKEGKEGKFLSLSAWTTRCWRTSLIPRKRRGNEVQTLTPYIYIYIYKIEVPTLTPYIYIYLAIVFIQTYCVYEAVVFIETYCVYYDLFYLL